MAAVAVWDACRRSALLLFGAMTGDPDADRIYAVLCQMGGDLSRTELHDALGRHGRRGDTDHALVLLASRGLVRRRRRRTAGRPEERVEVIDLAATVGRDLVAKSAKSAKSPPAVAIDPAPADLNALNALKAQGSRQHTSVDEWDPERATDDDAEPTCPADGSPLRRVTGSVDGVCTWPAHPRGEPGTVRRAFAETDQSAYPAWQGDAA
jgi:hypothetical protein